MNTIDFFNLVLPSEASGFRIIGTLAPGSTFFKHSVFATNAEAADKVSQSATTLNTYHALASFKQGFYVGADGKKRARTNENVSHLRSFWMDIDVKPGEEGLYQSRGEAMAEVKAFCTNYNLPRPMVVGSGRHGVHLYWVMDSDMPLEDWKPLAEILKQLAQSGGLLADHKCTADAARVLRPVGSYNLKLGADLVDAVTATRVYHTEDFFAAVESIAASAGIEAPVSELSIPGMAPAAAKTMQNNVSTKRDDLPTSLEKVAQHCNLINKSYVSGGAKDAEPVWYLNMGLAAYTDDVDAAVVSLAGGHSGFSLSGSKAKVVQWKSNTTGAPTCRALQDAHGDQCKTCPHVGKINSPISLGRYVNEAPQPVISSEELGLEEFVVPNPPRPFRRSVDKGIYYEAEDATGATVPVQICPYDIYPVRIQECERKDEHNVVWRAHLPHSGQKDITLPNRLLLAEGGKLMGELASRGVTVQPKNGKIMQEFMVGYIRQLQEATPVSVQFARLGWREDKTFVMPSGLCTPSIFVEFPSVQPFVKEIQGLTSANGQYEVKGDLTEWKKHCIDFYNAKHSGDERYLAHQAGFLLQSASPLLWFTNIKGVHVNLVGDSGSGKTTIGQLASSMWGHPTGFSINGGQKTGATLNSLFRSVSLRNNIGLVIDEISNWKGDYAGEFAYNISQGTGRMRMNGAESFAQFESWIQMTSSSSNQSMIEKIGGYKADSYAEMMRIIEIRVDAAKVHDKTQADEMLRHMNLNYGLAGRVIMQFIVANYAAIEKKVHKTMAIIDAEAHVDSSERFVSSGMASALVWGSVMKHLGLLDWDLTAIYKFYLANITGSRKTQQASIAVTGGLFNTLLNAHANATITMAGPVAHGVVETPLKPPQGNLAIHKELSTNTFFVATSLIRKYCTENGVDQKALAKELLDLGAIDQAGLTHRKVLGAGSIYASGQVRCWKIDGSKL